MNEEKSEEGLSQASEAALTEYKTETAVIRLEKFPGCQVKFTIHVLPKGVEAAYKKAVKTINKEVSLPGFRKGKAPEATIIKNYGSYIDREWKDILVQTSYHEAIKASQIYPLNKEAIKNAEVKKVDRLEGAEIFIEFESQPEIPDLSLEQFTLRRVPRKEVTEEQVNESLENIRLHHAEWTDIADRECQEGDYVDLDIQYEEHPEDYICKDGRFEVAKGKMGDWLRELVIGKKVGDIFVGLSEPSPELNPDANFQETHCRVTIKGIKQAKLADIDDELAKKVGVGNIEELRERIRTNLNTQADEEVQRQLRAQLEDSILLQHPFDVPSSLVMREIKNRLDYAKRALQKEESLTEEIKKKIAEIQPTIEAEVKNAFRLFFIARNIADKCTITISQQELVKELMLNMYAQASALDSSLDTEEARSKVYIALLTRKVEDYLIHKAKFKD